MTPSWYEELQRRQKNARVVPTEISTPPFNPETPRLRPWEFPKEQRQVQAKLSSPLPEPPRPPADQSMPPQMQTAAQEALRRRIDELAMAEAQFQNMPTWRKALGAVLEGVGESRRSGLVGGLARAGGAAVSGRLGLDRLQQTLPVYQRAAEHERIANAQQENLELRRQAMEETAQARQEQQALAEQSRRDRLLKLQADPTLEEINDSRPYSPERHSAEPFEIEGRYFAPIRKDVLAAQQRAASMQAEQENWLPVPDELRPYIPDMPRAPQSIINTAIRLKEMQQQSEKERAWKEEQAALMRQHRQDLAQLTATLNPAAHAQKTTQQINLHAGSLLKRFPRYEDAIDAARSDPDIPEDIRLPVIQRLESLSRMRSTTDATNVRKEKSKRNPFSSTPLPEQVVDKQDPLGLVQTKTDKDRDPLGILR